MKPNADTSASATWRRRADRPDVHRLKAHALDYCRIGVVGIRGDLAVAAGRGTADQSPDDRRGCINAGIQREGGRGARLASNGKAALGNSRG